MTLLLASDFDGTVAPIRLDPETVEIDPRARELFEWASRQPGVEVAFVSGRDLDDLRNRTRGIEAWRSGSHGQEIERSDGTLVRSAEAWNGSPPQEWSEKVRREGLRLERKKFGVALHWRGVEGIDENHALVREFEEWGRGEGLGLTRGRCVVEAALPGASKLAVIETLEREGGMERVFYAGDDITDLEAIAYAASHGRGVFVRSGEREVELPAEVETVGSTEELLRKMEDAVLETTGGAR
jgi:trehalose 6-phosphate synthase/phosphatase